jgi:hypothetical protein
MEQSTHATRLRYLDADDVDDAVVDYDGLDVYAADGQKVGDVDGFIIDPAARRVNYVVVDSGGWFTSRRFLLPIGHAALGPDKKSLQTDVTRDTLRRLPSFDHDRFDQLKEEELFAFERDTAIACCPDEPLESVAAPAADHEARRHFRQPDWWSSARYTSERLRSINRDAFAEPTMRVREGSVAPGKTSDEHNRELVTARDVSSETSREDLSPHVDRRAQPGDVLGIETGGETTAIGDTPEDENKRREQAEGSVSHEGAESSRRR